ncbi:hypothetical protein AJ80_00166 [Polytolypa hystricis UAMH7299]|uniref:Uncharacterized protein n=1 Tax=Polytolypa hystricis (strain UAMH7299) TaxID=1447883 RepID=A0A2B7Z3V6_POLH7|nr:hypothetical protein AJ80_00166 [Polytolypa hystricis UAMH7299]
MKRILGTLNRRASQSQDRSPTFASDSPEGILVKELVRSTPCLHVAYIPSGYRCGTGHVGAKFNG